MFTFFDPAIFDLHARLLVICLSKIWNNSNAPKRVTEKTSPFWYNSKMKDRVLQSREGACDAANGRGTRGAEPCRVTDPPVSKLAERTPSSVGDYCEKTVI